MEQLIEEIKNDKIAIVLVVSLLCVGKLWVDHYAIMQLCEKHEMPLINNIECVSFV